jgi:2-polyprenyl-6-hydroxyphenyl methylase/3-demethylubiquinone-9 3-methyltransferase
MAVDSVPEHFYGRAEACCSHAYLLPPVLSAIDDFRREQGDPGGDLRVLDAGCGNGFLAGRLAARGWRVAACDASESGIEVARRAYATVDFEVLSVYDDLVGRFGSGWDVVVSTEVIEHLYGPRAFVGRVRELLRPGGLFVVSTPYHGYLKNLALAVAGSMDDHFTALWDGGHIKFWSYRTLRTLLGESGFSRFEFRGAGRLPWLWKSMVVSCRKAG